MMPRDRRERIVLRSTGFAFSFLVYFVVTDLLGVGLSMPAWFVPLGIVTLASGWIAEAVWYYRRTPAAASDRTSEQRRPRAPVSAVKCP